MPRRPLRCAVSTGSRFRPSPARRRDESRDGLSGGRGGGGHALQPREFPWRRRFERGGVRLFLRAAVLDASGSRDYQYLITFSGMLITALVISTQTARIRDQAAEVTAREARNETLYRLSRRWPGRVMVMDVARPRPNSRKRFSSAHVLSSCRRRQNRFLAAVPPTVLPVAAFGGSRSPSWRSTTARCRPRNAVDATASPVYPV